jgi:hypothetical protein
LAAIQENKDGNEHNQQEFKQKKKTAFAPQLATYPYRNYKENSRICREYLALIKEDSRHRVTTFIILIAMKIF